jgi:hypothetical protein
VPRFDLALRGVACVEPYPYPEVEAKREDANEFG